MLCLADHAGIDDSKYFAYQLLNKEYFIALLKSFFSRLTSNFLNIMDDSMSQVCSYKCIKLSALYFAEHPV